MNEIKTPLTDAEVEERSENFNGMAVPPMFLAVDTCREIEKKVREELTLAKQQVEQLRDMNKNANGLLGNQAQENDKIVSKLEQERDQLQKQLAKIKDDLIASESLCATLQDGKIDLENKLFDCNKQLVKAGKDKERLDWLDLNADEVEYKDEYGEPCTGYSTSVGWTNSQSMRQAIDAAIESQKGGTE